MKLFQKVKEIKSKAGELHFERFAIIETSKFSIYIHKIYKADKDIHLHSHPWNFFSLILKGGYVEHWRKDQNSGFTDKEFLSFGKADRNYFHKIAKIIKGPVTTFFVTWGEAKNWYYMVDDKRIPHIQYRIIKNTTGFN